MDYQQLLIGVVRDISERKSVEKKIEEARLEAISANQAKSNFLASMSHEIRTPMNAILGYSQILLRDKTLNLEQRQGIETISRSGNNLLELLNDILDISKIEAGRMTFNRINFNLSNTLRNIQSLFKASCLEKQLSWYVENFDQPILVYGDETKIRQILINLIGNAIKFTDKGGVYLIAAKDEKNNFRFEVRDSGNGIPPENFRSIFEPFRQNEQGFKKGGTGLGLAISQMQAKLMKGEITVESKVGKGSSFILTLPLPPSKIEIEENTDKPRNVIHLKEGYDVSALVVDEIKENREVLSKLLKSIGAEVMEAENGKVAIEKFEKQRPDIIFMDICMPIMDGLEAIHILNEKKSEQDLNIVIVSASALKHEQEKYENLGCKEILLKPFKFDEVFQIIQKLLNVEYELEKVETKNDAEIDYSKIKISKNILSSIKESSTSCNLTKLEESFQLLKADNASEEAFINQLNEHKNSYDMASINKLLEKLENI